MDELQANLSTTKPPTTAATTSAGTLNSADFFEGFGDGGMNVGSTDVDAAAAPAGHHHHHQNHDARIPHIFRQLTRVTTLDQCPGSPVPMSQSCPQTGFWPYVFSFQFLIFLKLILMTLLYALFANTASRLQTETDHIWKFQRYQLVIDFAHRPALHAPLSLLRFAYKAAKALQWLITCGQCCRVWRLRRKGGSDQTVCDLLSFRSGK